MHFSAAAVSRFYFVVKLVRHGCFFLVKTVSSGGCCFLIKPVSSCYFSVP